MRTAIKFALLAATTLAVPSTGCNDPLNVRDPDIVPPGNLNDPTALPTLRAGAIGDFALAYSGSGADGSGGTVEGVIMYGGLLADEWVNSETFPTRLEVDARGPIQITNADVGLWFRNMHRARRSSEFAAERYRTLSPDTTKETGFPEVLALAGYTYVLFAETWCSGVPVSRVASDGTIAYGGPLTTAQLLDTAIARFDAALAAARAIPVTSIIRLATVGKARALVDKGDFAAAAALAVPSAVPTTFSYVVQHTENTTRENNGVFNGNVTFERYSVGDREGQNGFPFRSSGLGFLDVRGVLSIRVAGDARIPYSLTFERYDSTRKDSVFDRGFDNVTRQFDNLRYGDRKTAVTLATGAEARLIEAEGALQAGDTGSGGVYLTKLTELRAAPPSYYNSTRSGVAAVPPLAALTTSDIAGAGGAVNTLFNERAVWLWLTGHRLGDLRRLVRQYNRLANAVFPTGAYFKAQIPTYGNDVNFPVPKDEENNPNFTQCINRNP